MTADATRPDVEALRERIADLRAAQGPMFTLGYCHAIDEMERLDLLRAAVHADATRAAEGGQRGRVDVAMQEALLDARTERDAMVREVARLGADLATFTAEPDIRLRLESDRTTYWHNQTLLADGKASAAETAAAIGRRMLERVEAERDAADAEVAALRTVLSNVRGWVKSAQGYLVDAETDGVSGCLDGALDSIAHALAARPAVLVDLTSTDKQPAVEKERCAFIRWPNDPPCGESADDDWHNPALAIGRSYHHPFEEAR